MRGIRAVVICFGLIGLIGCGSGGDGGSGGNAGEDGFGGSGGEDGQGSGGSGGAGGSGGVGGSGGSGGSGGCRTHESSLETSAKDPSFFKGLCEINGGLTILYSELTNLEVLSDLQRINGGLRIESNDSLTSLDGLQNLKYAESVSIARNRKLASIEALSGLRTLEKGLAISGTELTSLAGLQVEELGALQISNNEFLRSIEALRGITHINGSVLITYNPELGSLAGLEDLEEVGGWLEFYNLPLLTDIDPLEKLTRVGGGLRFIALPELRNLDGLRNIVTIGMAPPPKDVETVNVMLWLNSLERVETIHLDELTEIGGALYASSSPKLVSLRMNKLRRVGSNPAAFYGELDIMQNRSLATLELRALESVRDDARTQENPMLASLRLDSLSRAGGLYSMYNTVLTDMQYGENIEVAGNVRMQANPILPTLAGLAGLRLIGGQLALIANDAITSLAPLDDLGQVDGDLIIQMNKTLPTCEVDALVGRLGKTCNCDKNGGPGSCDAR